MGQRWIRKLPQPLKHAFEIFFLTKFDWLWGFRQLVWTSKLYKLKKKGLYSWQIGNDCSSSHKIFEIKWNQCSCLKSDNYDPASHLNSCFLQLFSWLVKWYFVCVCVFHSSQNGGNMNYANANRNWWRLHLRSEQLQQFPLNVCLVSWINSAASIAVNHSPLIFMKTRSLWSIFHHSWIQTYQFYCRHVNFAFDFSTLLHTFFLGPFSVAETFFLFIYRHFCVFKPKIRGKKESRFAAWRARFLVSEVAASKTHH